MEDKEEKKEVSIEDTIKVIKEEYENKISQMKKDHEEEIEKIKKEKEEEKLKTIRALMSGRQVENSGEPAPEPEKSFEEQLIEDTRKKLGLKGGN